MLIGLSLIPSFVYSCNIYFSDHLKVRALTEANYPIPNAAVTISYQYDYGRPNRQVTHTTDARGIAEFDVRNDVGLSSRLDCNIHISVVYLGVKKSTTVITNLHGHPVDVFLNAYKLTVYPIDQTNKPLTNVTILVDNMTLSSSAGGFYAIVTSGKHLVTLVYKGRKSSRIMDISRDARMNLQVGNYPITLEIIDDYGREVPNATVDVSGEPCRINLDGLCHLTDLPTSTVVVTVTYKGKVYTNNYNLLISNFYKFPLDTLPPKISNMSYKNIRDSLVFSVVVTDDQSYASGIKDIKVRYKLDDSVAGHSVNTYVKSNNVYAFEIKNPGINHKIYISIFAKDGADNNARKDYLVNIYEINPNNNKNEQQLVNGTTNSTNSTNSTTTKNDGFKFVLPIKIPSAVLMVLGVIISIGGLYYLYRWKTGGTGDAS